MADERSAARFARIVNDFAHDMATGMWAACLLVIWVLSTRTTGVPPEAAEAISSAMGAAFLLLLAALTVLVGTGAARLSYWRRDTPTADVAAKRTALVVKHVTFLALYGAGTLAAASLLR